jgi:hypothetical protein
MSMKMALAFFLFMWLLCGAAAAWLIGERKAVEWRDVALGPISLLEELQLASYQHRR